MLYFTLLFKFEVFGRLFFFFEEIDKLILNLHEGIKSQNIPEKTNRSRGYCGIHRGHWGVRGGFQEEVTSR